MVEPDRKKILSKRMRKQNRSQVSGEKQGEINLTLKIGYF
jgi:hypothetical protein